LFFYLSEKRMDVALKAMMAELAPVIRDFVSESLVREIAPLNAENEALRERIATLESRQPEKGEQGEPGERGVDGVAPDPEEIAEAFSERLKAMIDEAVAEIPPAEKGEKGEPGAGVDPMAVNEMVIAEVQKAVASLPKPKDGKDAAGIVEALKDSGELVLTLQDGRLIRTGVRDGEKGQDGNDGFGFDDMDACVLDDDRTIELSFRRGEEEKAFTFKWPTAIYRGVYREGETYSAGDMTTWGGSCWSAERSTSAKPDSPDSGWK
jgi:regulator of replication initiation timing